MRLAAVIGCVMLSLVPILSGQAQDPSALNNPPDPIQRVGSMADLMPQTAGERARAKLFDFPGPTPLKPGDHVGNSGGGPIVNLDDVFEWGPDGTLIPRSTPRRRTESELFQQTVCSSDAVVVGRPESRRTMLTTSGTVLFTDYHVSVLESIGPIQLSLESIESTTAPRRILITHAGGEVVVGGKATSYSYPREPMRATRMQNIYVFFLKSAPVNVYGGYGVYATGENPVLVSTGDEKSIDVDYFTKVRTAWQACGKM